MNVVRNIKLHDFILSTLCFQKQILVKNIFSKVGKLLELCDFKKGVALKFALHLGNHKPQLPDFVIVCKENNSTLGLHYR